MYIKHLMTVTLPDFIQEAETVLRAELSFFARGGVKCRVQRCVLEGLSHSLLLRRQPEPPPEHARLHTLVDVFYPDDAS
jgi:hypothetical protein